MNCRPGDLAVIVMDDDFPVNVGAFVRVVERASIDKWGESEDGTPEWVCDHDCELWGFAIEDNMPFLATGPTVFSERQLRPIRPKEQEEKTKAKETV